MKQRYDSETGYPLFKPVLMTRLKADPLKEPEQVKKKIAISAHLFIQTLGEQKVSFLFHFLADRKRREVQEESQRPCQLHTHKPCLTQTPALHQAQEPREPH